MPELSRQVPVTPKPSFRAYATNLLKINRLSRKPNSYSLLEAWEASIIALGTLPGSCFLVSPPFWCLLVPQEFWYLKDRYYHLEYANSSIE